MMIKPKSVKSGAGVSYEISKLPSQNLAVVAAFAVLMGAVSVYLILKFERHHPVQSSFDLNIWKLFFKLFAPGVIVCVGSRLLLGLFAKKDARFRTLRLYRYVRVHWQWWLLIYLIVAAFISVTSMTWFAGEAQRLFDCKPIATVGAANAH